MTLNLPLLYFVWLEEYCRPSPNKKKSPSLWHVTSILVCFIFCSSKQAPVFLRREQVTANVVTPTHWRIYPRRQHGGLLLMNQDVISSFPRLSNFFIQLWKTFPLSNARMAPPPLQPSPPPPCLAAAQARAKLKCSKEAPWDMFWWLYLSDT